MSSPAEPAATARAVMRGADRAALATLQHDAAGWPYASLVLVALDHDASPLLLLSDLAEHSRNMAADSRVSLLFDATAGLDDPLTGARVTVLGTAEKTADDQLRARFLGRHPAAAGYAGFADFHLYRVAASRGHLVAGFGRIHWIDAADLLFDAAGAAPLAAAEADIVAHMNGEHADAVALYATRLLGHDSGEGWMMTGIDPEGCDLRRGGAVARLVFARPVEDEEAARVELVRLVKEARRR